MEVCHPSHHWDSNSWSSDDLTNAFLLVPLERIAFLILNIWIELIGYQDWAKDWARLRDWQYNRISLKCLMPDLRSWSYIFTKTFNIFNKLLWSNLYNTSVSPLIWVYLSSIGSFIHASIFFSERHWHVAQFLLILFWASKLNISTIFIHASSSEILSPSSAPLRDSIPRILL